MGYNAHQSADIDLGDAVMLQASAIGWLWKISGGQGFVFSYVAVFAVLFYFPLEY